MITASILICLAPLAIDGDTIKCANVSPTIRIFGIQAPERNTSEGPASRNSLHVQSAGGLLCEPKGTNYSRIVALCRNGYGHDIGKAQLDLGFATEWCTYSKNYYGKCQ